MTHQAKALPKWTGKILLSLASPARAPAAVAPPPSSRSAIALGVALRYLALRQATALRATPPSPRPILRVVT